MIAQSKSIERFVAAKYGKGSARFLLCVRESICLFVLLFTEKSYALTRLTEHCNALQKMIKYIATHCSTQC